MRNEHGETRLHLAAARGDQDMMKILLDNGAFADIKDSAGWTPLHETAAEGFFMAVQLLLT